MNLQEKRNRLAGKTIYLLPYCHADYAWRYSRDWHINRYSYIFDEVMELLEKHSELKYTFDTWDEFLNGVIENGVSCKKMNNFIAQKRVSISSGQYGNLRFSMVGEEAGVRNIVYGQREVQKYFPEHNSKVYCNLDVEFGHSQLPQIMELADIKGYLGWRPCSFMDKENVPKIFRWQGLSGHEVIAGRQFYGDMQLNDTFADKNPESCWDELVDSMTEHNLLRMIEQDVPVIYLFNGMDDTRLFRRLRDDKFIDIMQIIRLWNEKESSCLKLGTPEELVTDLEKHKEQLPSSSLTEPSGVCYNIAFNGSQGLWKLRQQLEILLYEAETTSTIVALNANTPYPETAITDTWKELLAAVEHARELLYDQDLSKTKLSLENSIVRLQKLIKDGVSSLQKVDLQYRCSSMVFVNLLPYARKEFIPIAMLSHDRSKPNVRFKNGSSPITSQILNNAFNYPMMDEKKYLIEVEVPPMGQTVIDYEFTEKTANESSYSKQEIKDVFKTAEVSCIFSEQRIVKLEIPKLNLKIQGSESNGILDPVLIPNVCYNGKWMPQTVVKPVTENCRYSAVYLSENGPLRWTITREGNVGPNKFIQEIYFYKNRPTIETYIELELNDSEGCFIGLSMPISNYPGSKINADIPFGVEERNVEKIRYVLDDDELENDRDIGLERRFQNLFWAKQWVAVDNSDASYALITIEGHKYYLIDSNKKRLIHILTKTMPRPAMGNWERKTICGKQNGIHTFRHAVSFYKGNWDTANLPLLAKKITHPVNCYPVKSVSPKLPPQVKLLSDSCIITALYMENNTVVLRFYNASAYADTVNIKTAFNVISAEKINLKGDFRQTVAICNERTLSINYGKWEIVTLKMNIPNRTK